jgi:nucleoside-diphosphate-sugar epimerase
MIFVTGANGMLGSQLVRYLIQRGEKVRALKRKTSDLSLLGSVANKVEWIEGDVLDIASIEEGLKDVTHVYHVAATISFIPSEKGKMFKTNIEGTANIVNCCLDAEIEKLVHVSSIAAFGNAKENVLLNEEAQWEEDDIRSGYAECKFLSEMEVWRGMAEGLRAVIVNPSLIVGPGWWNGTGPSAIFKKIDQGLPTYTSGTNGYVDVRDVAAIMIQLMSSDIINQRFVVSAENLTYLEYFSMISKALGKQKPFVKISNTMGAAVSWLDALRASITNQTRLITPEMIYIANKKMLFDNTKIVNALGYKFRPIAATVEDTAKVYAAGKNQQQPFGVFED